MVVDTQIPVGFKHTDLGVIPENWNIKVIDSFRPFVTSGSRGWASFYSEHGFPFIRITNLSRESIYLNLGDLKYVSLSSQTSEASRTQIQDRDILISITADIGIIGFVTSEVPKPAYINQHIALVRINDPQVDNRFLSYFLASQNSQKNFKASTDLGAKAGMSLITVKKIPVILPPIREQKAISDALSDMDTLLAELEKLLIKKRLVRQGARHELLTGKRRLPGFDGEWKEIRLGDMAGFLKGSGLSKDKLIHNGRYQCILYGELFTTYSEVIRSVKSKTNFNEGLLSKTDDLLMPGSTTTIGIDLAKASALQVDNVLLGGDIIVIRKKKQNSYNPFFLANYLTHISKYKIGEISQGITIIHLHASRLQELFINIPSDVCIKRGKPHTKTA
jgi:type I restriction enzyme S subunit